MKKNKKPRYSEARNLRRQQYKYYYVDDDHRYAVEGGRCYQCDKITDAYCDKCNAWICENHMIKPKQAEYECFCNKCV